MDEFEKFVEEFVRTWMKNNTLFDVSDVLIQAGYEDAKPTDCLDWFLELRSQGVRLPTLQLAVLN